MFAIRDIYTIIKENRFKILNIFIVLSVLSLFITSCIGNNPKIKYSVSHKYIDNVAYIEPINNIRYCYVISDKHTIDSLSDISRNAMYFAIHENEPLLHIRDEIEIKSKNIYLELRNEIVDLILKIKADGDNFKIINVPPIIQNLAKFNNYALITYQQNIYYADGIMYINDILQKLSGAFYNSAPDVVKKNNFKLILLIFDLQNNKLAFYGEIDNPDINPLNQISLSEQYSIIINSYRNKIIRGK